ncbi:tetratricopeptide repeat protein [Chryseobacterium sp. AG363]|uniref:tetratricopeptide repeat protein n=1 Tax=Chryseobacterium sp. AG363 TaxID=2183997 RepID=UPI000FF025CE|nr:hypothetical protein [Chryseobacterium sp. AG363]RKE77165.1 hypothetical protein DEU39_3924 [Chryseobacterium sp. AG363]
MKICKVLFFCFLLMLSTLSSAQIKKEKLAKYTIEKSKEYFNNYEDIQAFKKGLEALSLAKNTKNKTLVAEAYFTLAPVCVSLGFYERALQFSQEGIKICPKGNYNLLAGFYITQGYIFLELNLYQKAVKNYHKSLNLAKKESRNTIQKKTNILSAYQKLLAVHSLMSNKDSISYYTNKEKQTLFSIPKDSLNEAYIDYYFNYAMIAIENKNDKEAKISLEESCKLCEKHNKKTLYICHFGLGEYYYNKDKKRSLDHFLQSIEIMEKFKIRGPELNQGYSRVSKLYYSFSNLIKQSEYLQKYIKAEENEKIIKQKSIEEASKLIVETVDYENENEQKKRMLIFFIIIFFVISISVYFTIKIFKSKKIVVNRLNESETKS